MTNLNKQLQNFFRWKKEIQNITTMGNYTNSKIKAMGTIVVESQYTIH
jgi:hypothetical protein